MPSRANSSRYQAQKAYMGGATSRPGLPYAVTDIFSVAVDVLRRGGIRLDPSRNEVSVTYHDPCNFSRSGGIM